jgi:MFS family permease
VSGTTEMAIPPAVSPDAVPGDAPHATGFTPAQIRRNMIAVIMLDSIYATGWTDLMLALVPLWVYLKASNRTIGALNALTSLAVIGLIVSPWITRLFHVKKYYLLVSHIPYLAPLGIAGLGVFFNQQLHFSNANLLTFMIVMIAAHQFFAGFTGLPHTEYVAACIPMSHRGRYTGLSASIGTVTSLISMAIGGVILARVDQPKSFGILLLMTWCICQGGYLIAMFAKESPVPTQNTPRPWSRGMFKSVWNDKAFLRVLLLRQLGQLTFLPAMGFATFYGLKDLKMAAAVVATQGMFTGIARVSSAAPFGWLTDRLGAKRLWGFAPLGAAIFFASLLLIPGHWQLIFPKSLENIGVFSGPLAIFACGMISTTLVTNTWAASGVLLYGMPHPNMRPSYYTIQLLSDAAAPAIGAFVMGCLYDALSYRTMFLIMLIVSLALFLLMRLLLRPLSNDANAYS